MRERVGRGSKREERERERGVGVKERERERGKGLQSCPSVVIQTSWMPFPMGIMNVKVVKRYGALDSVWTC